VVGGCVFARAVFGVGTQVGLSMCVQVGGGLGKVQECAGIRGMVNKRQASGRGNTYG